MCCSNADLPRSLAYFMVGARKRVYCDSVRSGGALSFRTICEGVAILNDERTNKE